MTLFVATDRLPRERHARHARLRDYFCDKDATAVPVDDGWRLDLSWPTGAHRHVDPRLTDNLSSWGGIGLSDMALARRRSGKVLTSLYDTWSLLTWSEWAARARPDPDEPIIVLHVDDHRDLMSPRLAVTEAGLVDMVTDAPFDVRDPASVLAACESGAVGMGSFLTPFLLAFRRCDVRHLCQPPKVSTTTDFAIVETVMIDDLLRPGARRPAIALVEADGAGPGRYRATSDLPDWLAGIGDGPILLHVDMDYFSNRYDGDGDWVDRVRRLDPDPAEVMKRIDEVTSALRQAGMVDRIVDAAVAFSPGFFPSELWVAAEARLQRGLRTLYD